MESGSGEFSMDRVTEIQDRSEIETHEMTSPEMGGLDITDLIHTE